MLSSPLTLQPSSLGSGVGGGLPLSSENGNIGNLIDDAMEDIMAPMNAPPKATPTSHRVQSRSKKPKITSSQSKSKMEIHVSGDNSVVMEFNSDTDDDDDDDNILRELMSHHRPRQNVTNGSGGGGRGKRQQREGKSPAAGKSMKQSGSDYGSIFSESDEDFCFVDAPTITKVVSDIHVHVL